MILIFLGSFRSTLAIFLSIPLSILAGAFGLMMSGETINIMTLCGFALAIGRLVDDSTVVLENINRHLADGEEPREAARRGADEVALPVLASTITTIIVFFPVMFLFGVAKYLFSALALTVVLAMVASYVVAMTVIPIYCARFLNQESALEEEHGGKGFFGAFLRVYARFAAGYERLLSRALETLKNIPVSSPTPGHAHEDAVLLRNVANIVTERHPAEADHYNIQRVVDVLVSPRSDDLGGTQDAVQRAINHLVLPEDIKIDLRGSVAAMQESFSSFGFGLGLAVVLLYLVMVAQFRSFLDPLIIMLAVPMGLIGVIWTLYLTGTTLNIESFMGIIVMVGIVVSNSILLVDFANQRRRDGQP